MKKIGGLLVGLLSLVIVVALVVIFSNYPHRAEGQRDEELNHVLAQEEKEFDADFESRQDYIDYINQLPPYDPYVQEPAEDVAKIAQVMADEFSDTALAQMKRNPPTMEYYVRTLGEDPTDEALTPESLYPLDDPSLVYFSQWDQRWAFKQYNQGDIAVTACGPTTLATLYANMTGDLSQTPDKVSAFAEENGYSVPEVGTAWDLMSEGAAAYGLQAEVIPLEEATLKNTLNEGRPIIAILGGGENFTTSGHFIILWAVKEDKFQVIDVFDSFNSNRLWDYDEFAGQVLNLWAYTYNPY